VSHVRGTWAEGAVEIFGLQREDVKQDTGKHCLIRSFMTIALLHVVLRG
jgi:hypothetical protein